MRFGVFDPHRSYTSRFCSLWTKTWMIKGLCINIAEPFNLIHLHHSTAYIGSLRYAVSEKAFLFILSPIQIPITPTKDCFNSLKCLVWIQPLWLLKPRSRGFGRPNFYIPKAFINRLCQNMKTPRRWCHSRRDGYRKSPNAKAFGLGAAGRIRTADLVITN